MSDADVERGADDIRAPQGLTHEELEKWVGEMPKVVLDRLPDNTEAREARRLHAVLDELAHDSLERPADRR